ncbi:hypothetical protein BC938DRAFT_476523 [Jimgerdemannia flammicorona]|uniref:Uncharacterized protein n=1 Tax=Jimgerdemannia flammicorona TaxID=994334 RepID=A0A433R0T9_9FUNG|nr:hypothetical protein BC938DRAFT_476523 [Jimgerdemannia flammicorona]
MADEDGSAHFINIIDHSGQHGPTTDMLAKHLPAAKRAGDVSVRTDEDYRVRDFVVSIFKAVTMPGKDNISEIGEQTLEPTAVWRNAGSNPTRAGCQSSDAVRYLVVSRAKEWMDTLKLGLEFRDVWAIAQKELIVVDAASLVIWDFTVVGRKLRIYALAAAEELW